MLQRFCYLYIASYIYISLLLLRRQDNNDCCIFIRVIATSAWRNPQLQRHRQHPPHSITSKQHSTNVPPYSYIQHINRRRTLIGSLRHIRHCFAKPILFRRRELLVVPSSLGGFLLQPQFQNTMASATTTPTPNDIEILKNEKVINQCRILCISDKDDPNNTILYDLPRTSTITDDAVVLHIVSNLTNVDDNEDELQSLIDIILEKQINTIFISDTSAQFILAYLLPRLSIHYPSSSSKSSSPSEPQQQSSSHPIVWIHSRSAGIDSYLSPALMEWYHQGTDNTISDPTTTTSYTTVQMTNAKGMFSSTLAEYSLGACTYFSKDFNRLKRNQQQRSWEKYSVSELRGSTIGIIGYGDIGRATARLAKAYGMKVLALVRTSRSSCDHDEYADVLIANDVSNNDGLNRIFIESDYVLCALPLTASTHRCIGAQQFALCKPNCVFINVGRGPIVDEDALIAALQTKRLKGAALDVFTIEPLPTSSPLWDMDNVLMSPHNMDQTDTFLIESTTFFVQEQIPRFIRGLPLLNQVNPTLGY